MNQLAEKRGLIALYQGLGQPIPADLQAQIADLEQAEAVKLERENKMRARIAEDLSTIFQAAEAAPAPPAAVVEAPVLTQAVEPVVEAAAPAPKQTTAQIVANLITEQGVVAPDPVLAQPQKDLERELRYLREWIGKIAATGPGGGAAQIYNLDMPTTTVTGDYVIKRKDYYIGVNSTVKTYITLPTAGVNLKNGRVVIIKDESGHAQLTPIAIVGTIDNDPNGAEIRINNGAVQLIYRDGWRII